MTVQLAVHPTELLITSVLQEVLLAGVKEFCICPGARNAPFVQALTKTDFQQYYWPEERSAAFFALGRSRSTGRPVAIITTSGTASAELLPAAIEAYYSGVPLLLITADRPRRYRGTGAPQSAEQVNLFGPYALSAYDIAAGETFQLDSWTQKGPAHLNICIEEPKRHPFDNLKLTRERHYYPKLEPRNILELRQFRHPFVVVSTLKQEDRESVVQFLLQLNAPVYVEAISNLRGDSRLSHLIISRPDQIWNEASRCGYTIDCVIRLGGVPTFRSWRDLEGLEGHMAVISINDVPFSGLSWGEIICTSIGDFVKSRIQFNKTENDYQIWLESDRKYAAKIQNLLYEYITSEPGLIHQLSQIIPEGSLVYLGNSLPIREWDQAAVDKSNWNIQANRGVNGIDGQLSTFFGLSQPHKSNWIIVGDLTTLYDMAGLWILKQLPEVSVNIVVINNGGGQIFSRMFKEKEILNEHHLEFSGLAQMWGIPYEKWEGEVKPVSDGHGNRLIEIVPDVVATENFWEKLK